MQRRVAGAPDRGFVFIAVFALAIGVLAGCHASPIGHGDTEVVERALPPEDVTATPPPSSAPAVPAACGAAGREKCALGRACARDADCASGVCAGQGPWSGRCTSARSCTGGAGAGNDCEGDVDCCTSIRVPGGVLTRHDDEGRPVVALVSRFRLDKYEITVGRLRAYFEAVNGSPRAHPPSPGAAEHPLIERSGWRASWNVRLPGSWAEIHARMGEACAVGGDNTSWGAATWTPSPGANEDKPVNCLDWYTLFAFCAWDEGRLPTDAEWSYVAASGDEQRLYPWGNDAPDFETHARVVATAFRVPGTGDARYTEGTAVRAAGDGPLHIARVGAKTGRSRWGHADMAGNVLELVLDAAEPVPARCNNCAASVAFPDPPQGAPVQPLLWQPLDASGAPPAPGAGDDFADARAVLDGRRVARGGSWQGEVEGHPLDNARSRHAYPVWRTSSAVGARCARSAP